MPVHNNDVAKIFNEIADLLEIKGANQFRVRAYREAARTVGGLSRSVGAMIEEGEDLSELSGIGEDLAGKIAEIVKTGSLPLLEDLEKEIPPELSDLMKVPNLGPKKVSALYEKLNIDSREDLKKAAENGKIRDLKGFGEKTEENILEELQQMSGEQGRFKLPVAEGVAGSYVDYLKRSKKVKKINVAGSYRRRKETVGDLDILIACKKGAKIMERFVEYEDVDRVVSKGKTKSTVILKSGLQVDLRVIPEAGYGAALHYFTGSKTHNIAVRKIGVEKGYKINEYGVYKGKKRVAGKTEEDVYERVKLPYIPPELRENRGEIEAAQKDSLPDLVELDDIRGDLHVHTRETDGHYTAEQMVKAAKERGYDYVAITDHSKAVTVAGGLNVTRLRKQMELLDELNGKIKGIRILKGIEIDILEDGSLDLTDDVLNDLDIVVGAVHSKFDLSKNKQTDRIIKAMDNPHVNIIDHPTGRLINERKPYEVDMKKILKAAVERGCFVELNAHPDRLDLDDRNCKLARDIGVKIVISTDAHHIHDLEFMRFGVGQARRGWLEPDDVINTRKWKDLEKLLKRG